MMSIKRINYTVLFGALLVIVSVAIYAIQLFIFHESTEEAFLFFQDLAFVPLEVLLVSLVIDRILSKREKDERIEKIKIVIFAFFTDTGTSLIRELFRLTANADELRPKMSIKTDSSDTELDNLSKQAKKLEFSVGFGASDLVRLHELTSSHKGAILSLFGNPNLLEHDTFTNLLWAILHLADELDSRESLEGLPSSDSAHLEGDIKRVLQLITAEWAWYMKHLKKEYPYLYSLAVRKNPFMEEENVVIYS